MATGMVEEFINDLRILSEPKLLRFMLMTRLLLVKSTDLSIDI